MKISRRIALVLISMLALWGGPEAAWARFVRAPNPIKNQYIVVFRGESTSSEVKPDNVQVNDATIRGRMQGRYRARLRTDLRTAVNGATVTMTEEDAKALANDPDVALVEEDGMVYPSLTQTGAPWHLDRIDQRDLPLNQLYAFSATGKGVNVYVIDSGIRSTHIEFRNGTATNATRVKPGRDFVGDGRGTEDCMGHGTHVAGIIAGATFGVAKEANLYPVRIFGCSGGASFSSILTAIDWVAANHIKPAVVNISAGGMGTVLNTAVENIIRKQLVPVVVAAGNSNFDACNYSPSGAPAAITVAATGNLDGRAGFSNYGACVDIFAPGVNISSAIHRNDTGSVLKSGTSMAAPVVTGVVSQILSSGPKTPDQVWEILKNRATPNKVTNARGPTNLLVYAQGDNAPPPPVDTTPPTVTLLEPKDGQTIGSSVTLAAMAQDNVGVAMVEFYASGSQFGSNGKLLGSGSLTANGRYELKWNTGGLVNGAYGLWARAIDKSQNSADSFIANVTIFNAVVETCTTTSQVMANPGFESGRTGWIESSNLKQQLIIQSTGSRTGNWLARLRGVGRSGSDALGQNVLIPADACKAKLGFWARKLKGPRPGGRGTPPTNDLIKLEAITGSGRSLTTTLLAQYRETELSESIYINKQIDLLAFKGKTIQLKFTGTEDVSWSTAFLIDDVRVDITK